MDRATQISDRQRRDEVILITAAEEPPQPTTPIGNPSKPTLNDHDLNSAPLPPATRTRQPRQTDPHQVQDHNRTHLDPHDPNQNSHQNLHQTLLRCRGCSFSRSGRIRQALSCSVMKVSNLVPANPLSPMITCPGQIRCRPLMKYRFSGVWFADCRVCQCPGDERAVQGAE